MAFSLPNSERTTHICDYAQNRSALSFFPLDLRRSRRLTLTAATVATTR